MVEHTKSAELDRIFAALSDPTRRAILQSLARRPASVSDIAKPFAISLNAVSKHIMVLERAGLLRREIKGREHHCRIEPHPLREAEQWLEHHRQFWEQRLDALAAYVARKYESSKHQSARKKTRHGNAR